MARFAFEPTLDCDIACSPRAPGEARRALEGVAHAIEDGLLRDVKLIVSELVTNSVRHSGSPEPIALRAWVRPNGLKVEVGDGGSGFEPRPARAGNAGEGGRGLLILEALAERWGITRDGRTRVWFEVSHRPVTAGSTRTG